MNITDSNLVGTWKSASKNASIQLSSDHTFSVKGIPFFLIDNTKTGNFAGEGHWKLASHHIPYGGGAGLDLEFNEINKQRSQLTYGIDVRADSGRLSIVTYIGDPDENKKIDFMKIN